MTAGFELIDRRFEQVDQRFEQVDQRFEQVNQRLDSVIDIVGKHHGDLEARVVRIETHLGLQPGAPRER